VILAEIGTDMSRFPTARHLLAWAGLCPSQNEGAGKRKRSRMRQGRVLAQDHYCPMRRQRRQNKDNYYKAQFSRLCAEHIAKKAFCTVAASMLTAI
jgi:transposase